MGADFIYQCVIIKETHKYQELQAELAKKIETLQLSDFTELDKENLYEQFGIEELNDDTLRDAKTQFSNIVELTFKTFDRRDCSILNFKGYNIHLTGGESWGDAPTDAFDIFCDFNALPECVLKLLD